MINKVLLIDDDEIMHVISKIVMKKTSFTKEIVNLENGKYALDYFQKLVEKGSQETIPDFIFLDINFALQGIFPPMAFS